MTTTCQSAKYVAEVDGYHYAAECDQPATETVSGLLRQHAGTAAACGSTVGLTETYRMCEDCASALDD